MARVYRIECGKCHATLNSKAGIPEGQAITCPKCKAKFKVPLPQESIDESDLVEDEGFEVVEEEDKPAPPKKKPSASTNAPTTNSKKIEKRKIVEEEDDEDEDDDPQPRKNDRSQTSEKKNPKKRKKRDEEDEAEMGTFATLKKNIWVRVSVLTVLLGTAGIFGYKLYRKNSTESDDKPSEKQVVKGPSRNSLTQKQPGGIPSSKQVNPGVPFQPPVGQPGGEAAAMGKLRKLGFYNISEDSNKPNAPVKKLGLTNLPFTDEAIQLFTELPHLAELEIRSSKVNDGTVAKLKSLPALTRISFRTQYVSMSELKQLKQLPKLELIAVDEPELTDDVIAEWKSLPALLLGQD